MLELLAAVVGFHLATAARPVKADAVWLAGDRITAARPAAQPVDPALIP